MDDIGEKVKDLVADCHERGIVAVVGLADMKKGEAIRAMDGVLIDILTVMTGVFQQLSEKSGTDLREMVDVVKKAALEGKEMKRRKKHGTTRKFNSAK